MQKIDETIHDDLHRHSVLMAHSNFNGLPLIQTSAAFEPLMVANSVAAVDSTTPKLCACSKDFADILSINKLLNVEILNFNSISHAARQLTDRQKNWINIENNNFRKAALIQEKLPRNLFSPLKFLKPIPTLALGHWTLIGDETMLISSACSSLQPNGIYSFQEDKVGPPSRAYLKLWEVFHRIGKYPAPESNCLDLGASPGGWTWVLANITKHVLALDKAELSPSILHNSKIKYIKGDILNFSWKTYLNSVSWLFCDAALSPEKIVPLFEEIICEFPHLSFICTLKQKGNNLSKETVRATKIAGTQVLCLTNNKHELTWCKLAPGTFNLI